MSVGARAITGLTFRGLRSASRGQVVTVAVTLAILVYLILGPLAMLLVASAQNTDGRLPFSPGTSFSLENYAQVFLSEQTYALLGRTLVFAAGSLAIGFFFAILLAWLVERTNMPMRNGVFVLIVASSALPGVISGIASVILLDPVNGWFNVAIRAVTGSTETRGPLDVYTIPGLILIQGLTLVPITFLLIASSFRAMDATFEEAAKASGARYLTTLRRVTIPLMTPAILSALVYQAVSAIEAFDIPAVIGLRGGIAVLSTQVYSEVHLTSGLPDYGIASTYGVLMIALAVVPLLLYNRISHRAPERFATVAGNAYRATRIDLRGWRYVALLLVLAYLFVTFALPFVVMLWMSVQPFYAVPSPASIARISFEAYETLFDDVRVGVALRNTVLMGVAVGLGSMALAFVTSWLLVRSKTRFKSLLDLLAFAPHAFPGVIIGLSVAMIYLMVPLPIYGTVWILVIALTTQYISLGTRLMNAGMTQIHVQLEEAASASGAPWRLVLTRILLPLILPAFLNGFLVIFLAAIKNLTLTLMLYSSQSVVLSTLIYERWEIGQTAPAAVLGVIMTIAAVILAIVVRRYGGSRAQER